MAEYLKKMQTVLAHILLLLVKAYRYGVSPFTRSTCGYVPTCSEYAVEAIQQHGPFRGTWLSAKRIARCHPLKTGGYDPVPDTHSHSCHCSNKGSSRG
ncbi:conserved hypothetical protein TIGR00278 [gamma proteobacterium HTCC5015]|nr:conserved hypothetical protein TIGR00278 [gamma proteobacterium HTCC5015]